ncbi:MAG: RNA-directed DNA polymerase [Candidatus Saccharibacteria bacterium]|nr:RNA-directed DNA polymerase [Candidatus Saccharibacteria bacterium]
MEDKEWYFTEDWLLRKLYQAERKARKGKTMTRDVYLFELHLAENLEQLAHDIWTGVYKPGRGIAFIIDKPVVREIFAAQFRDRIVHHFLYEMVYDWWDKRLINDSYSCRKGKGSLYGIERLKKHIRSVSRNYTVPTYVYKMDIKGYFMSLRHDLLYKRVCWGLDRQYEDRPKIRELLKYLWHEVIFDNPCKGVKIRGSFADWKKLSKDKSLFYQLPGVGIVIGNLSSQLLSNIFLDIFDRYVRFELGYKAYGRYVDDFFIVVAEKDRARLLADIPRIEKFLKDEMALTLHPKKRYFQEVHKGVEFLGAVIYPYHTVPTRRFKNNFCKNLAEVGMGYRDVAAVTSYLGRLKHMDGKKLAAKVFRQMGWWYNY